MKKKFAIVLALFLIAVVCSAGCIDPEDPVDPIDPVDPVDPVDPITPVDPVDPVVPTEEYSVMFMLNYGDAGAYTAETVKAGETVSKPASPTRSGYTFNGWFTAAEGGAVYDFTQPVNADVTLYAQWKKKSSGSSHSHSYTGAVTTSPTCGVAGVKTYTCGCGASYTEPIPATGQHKLDSSVPGKITCTVCGFETLVASEAVALVGDTTYTTFNDAVAAAKGGKTIILLKDGISATITENVIIGGNDKSAAFTYTNVADIHILKANWTAGNTVSLSGKTVVFEDESDDAGLLVVQYAFDNNKYDVYTENGLVSVFARLSPDSIINLTSNLDMTGKTVDAIDGNTGFRFNGYGYTISNLVGSEQGLFVHHSGSSDYYFYNVHLKDCSVTSATNYAGLFVGDADTCDELVIKDCTVTDCIVSSAKYAAAFVAYTAGWDVQNDGPVYSNVTIENCMVTGGSITGGGSTAVAIGHAGGNADTDSIITRLTVSNVVINGEDAEHTGIAVGTANVGKTYITDVKYDGITGNYNTAHPLYGRFVPKTTGKLVIDGSVLVTNDAMLAEAIANVKSGETILLAPGNYGVVNVKENAPSKPDFTIAASGTGVKVAGINGQSSALTSHITVKGVTIDNYLQTAGWYTGTAQKIKPCVGVWGGNYTFEDCTFNVTGESGAETGVMSWWTTKTGIMNFEKCIFNGGNDRARAMQIYGNYTLNVEECTFNTEKDYSIKYVGAPGLTATFENNKVFNTVNFVQTGSAPYAGKDYILVFAGNTLADGINHVYVDNDEGQTITIDGVRYVSSASQLAAAVADGKTNIQLAPGEYDVYGCGGQTLTLTGTKDTILKPMNEGEDGCDYGFGSAGTGFGYITFNGITIDTTANTGNYKGYAYMNAVYNNCYFVGGGFATINAGTYEFNNCNINLTGYVWTWGATQIDFNGCTFEGDSRSILAHGSANTVINIEDCTFAATEKGYTGVPEWTAVVEIDPYDGYAYTINFGGMNTITENYNGWTRVKDGSTGHTITGLN